MPRLWNTKLYSVKMADWHFWFSTFGILLYISAMWIAGINQGLYFQALNDEGFLRYTDFVGVLTSGKFLYSMRLLGGTIFFLSYLLLVVNMIMTIRSGKSSAVEVEVPAVEPSKVGTGALVFSAPILVSVAATILAIAFGWAGPLSSAVFAALGVLLIGYWAFVARRYQREGVRWHAILEGKSLLFTVLVLISILIGGLVELVPTIAKQDWSPAASTKVAGSTVPEHDPYLQIPYTPLELEGRDIYVREGCYVCHSQMVRPFRHETLRYDDWSRPQEYIYDRPFQWGSKRTGPDLHRLAGRYPNLWHYQHMRDPRETSPDSLMPSYPWLLEDAVDFDATGGKLQALQTLGVPYSDEEIDEARERALAQAQTFVDDLRETGGVEVAPDREIIALIAYLQQLGTLREPPALTASGEAE